MSCVIRRHRLPTRYRLGLTALWASPLSLVVLAIVSQRGLDPALFSPRFLLPALLMLVPALYVWREGIDVLPDGIYRRIHFPQYIAFAEMRRWHYDARENRRVLTVWDEKQSKLVECRAGHLTDFPALLELFEEKVG